MSASAESALHDLQESLRRGGEIRRELNEARSSLTDRELIFELLRVETEVVQATEELHERLTTGDYGSLVAEVTDRLDAGAVDAYYERCEKCDGRGVHRNGKPCIWCRNGSSREEDETDAV